MVFSSCINPPLQVLRQLCIVETCAARVVMVNALHNYRIPFDGFRGWKKASGHILISQYWD